MKVNYNGIEANFIENGNNIEQRLQEASRQNEAMMRKKNEYDYIYHFSHNRGNIVLWLDLPTESRILEVGSGGGGLTRCLTNRYPHVTVMEQNMELALQNITKTHENSFISYCGRYEEVLPLLEDGSFDCVIVNAIDLPFEEHGELLSQLYHKLCDRGILLYGIDNKYAPGSWFLENAKIRNMTTKKKSLQVLKDAGFSVIEEYFPVPDSIITMEIYEKDYLEKNGVDPGMYQLYNTKYDLEHMKNMLAECQKDGELSEHMTTFLYIAEKGGENV